MTRWRDLFRGTSHFPLHVAGADGTSFRAETVLRETLQSTVLRGDMQTSDCTVGIVPVDRHTRGPRVRCRLLLMEIAPKIETCHNRRCWLVMEKASRTKHSTGWRVILSGHRGLEHMRAIAFESLDKGDHFHSTYTLFVPLLTDPTTTLSC